MSKTRNYWLYKTEPGAYSFEDLVKDKKTNWDGVRNFQARNYLSQARKGDLVLIYHSVTEKAVAGVAVVTREAYPNPDKKKKGDWVQVDLKPLKSLRSPVHLDQLKENEKLTDLKLIRQSRLSVMPVILSHFKTILALGKISI